MKMPIVSLNNMAMNESVAATCCFQHINVNGFEVETTLNGGYIDKVATYSIDWKTNGKSWSVLEGDYADFAAAPLAIIAGVPHVYDTANDKYLNLTDTTFNTKKAGYEYCDHNTPECSYWNGYKTTFAPTHVGATVAHTAGGTKWAENHAAKRFNS